jgi:hypothetical protein
MGWAIFFLMQRQKKISETKITPLLVEKKPQEAIDTGIRQVFSALNASFTTEGETRTRAVYTTSAAIVFVLTIICLFLVARFAPTRYFFLSPLIGFCAGLIQSIGLAIVLGMLGLVMVLISPFTIVQP